MDFLSQLLPHLVNGVSLGLLFYLTYALLRPERF